LITPEAVTSGNAISLKSGIDPANLDNFFGLTLLAHETAHSIQADKYGGAVVFGALYLARSGTVYLKGKDAYQDNRYEVEAREFGDAFRAWLEKQYGREDPCKEFRGGK
jgi:hypothetical protein